MADSERTAYAVELLYRRELEQQRTLGATTSNDRERHTALRPRGGRGDHVGRPNALSEQAGARETDRCCAYVEIHVARSVANVQELPPKEKCKADEGCRRAHTVVGR
jgi:hypothetical protein